MDGKLSRVVFTLALAVGVAARAHAIPQLRLQSSAGADITISDGDSNDLSPVAGVVLFGSAIAGWSVNFTSALSKPLAGSELEPLLDLNALTYSSPAGGTLNIWLTDTDFGPHSAQVLAAIGGTTDGNVTFKAYYDESNEAFGTAHEITSQSFSPLAFAGAWGGQLNSATPYSLTLLVTLVHEGAKASSFDATIKVPEPGSMLLFGIGLLGLGPLVLRRGLSVARA